jgi:hypothetical protein
LTRLAKLDITTLNQLLMAMELQGIVASEQNVYRSAI